VDTTGITSHAISSHVAGASAERRTNVRRVAAAPSARTSQTNESERSKKKARSAQSASRCGRFSQFGGFGAKNHVRYRAGRKVRSTAPYTAASGSRARGRRMSNSVAVAACRPMNATPK
jgi:hypothetical protein